MNLKKLALSALAAASLATAFPAAAAAIHDGSKEHPLRVMLIPADGGTEDGTKADFLPIFNALTKTTGLNFDIKVGQSYGAVMEAICLKQTEIAFFGAASYLPVRDKGCAKLLAVAVHKGSSVYYSGVFASTASPYKSLKDTKGARLALGDVNSTSSFIYPVAMLMDAGVNLTRDMKQVVITGSHANSLKAVAEGKADLSGASFDSFEKAVAQGAIDPSKVRVLAKSEPIPQPPLAMSTALPESIQKKLKDGFNTVHQAPGITPDMIRGYGGSKVDRYDANFPESGMDVAGKKMALVDDSVKAEILKKAAQR
ncbi:MAG: phosphonate ABC transporter substrate-binding protein [Gallionellales bacterium 35-53-114]|jgi:phosphonate transport system substrate-binding protein|nr:MAG: phosphonate ABC transporter substrate-binding protein [Gallionellales bacterium 35-53-114]OYZ64339.1 MAG: phosphonate ABC transporter substrate-binding protein [Gallionellales bacterium 24-53-125]OZB10353.1 MAG: phosphonate ABC transporter substrate-binding protein [Gallionellales bacterium 39-52-133]HQS56960.1 phosphate/phosphite/phosphonate ABC transporter substrate-binding protein [Gallionellaceae bacterium]HQS75256.1 phosphate/phosphite/phosphonate ABC transporter substrate-binding 